LVQIHAKGYQFDAHTSAIKTGSICLQFFIINKDIHQCEDTDYVYVIVRTSPRATNEVRSGDLVLTGTMLVTPDLGRQANKTKSDKNR